VYFAVTVTDGGAISGNWVTGKPINAKIPNKVINMDMTNDNIGRFINNFSMLEVV
jgi:hypothetical protein